MPIRIIFKNPPPGFSSPLTPTPPPTHPPSACRRCETTCRWGPGCRPRGTRDRSSVPPSRTRPRAGPRTWARLYGEDSIQFNSLFRFVFRVCGSFVEIKNLLPGRDNDKINVSLSQAY